MDAPRRRPGSRPSEIQASYVIEIEPGDRRDRDLDASTARATRRRVVRRSARCRRAGPGARPAVGAGTRPGAMVTRAQSATAAATAVAVSAIGGGAEHVAAQRVGGVGDRVERGEGSHPSGHGVERRERAGHEHERHHHHHPGELDDVGPAQSVTDPPEQCAHRPGQDDQHEQAGGRVDGVAVEPEPECGRPADQDDRPAERRTRSR